MPWALLAAACLGMFVASSSGGARAPFLIDMARDLDTPLAYVANIMATTSIAWGLSSLVAGAWADRWGRRPFLIGGPVSLALCMALVAQAESFAAVMLWATAAGGCAGAYTGALMTEAASRTVDRQRGRALGWVMSGQSMALLVGIPGAAWIGAWIGWRGVNLVVGGFALAGALALFATTLRPAGSAGARRAGPAPSYRAILSGRVLRLLMMGIAERSCFALGSVYFATFLQMTYGLSLAALAIPLAIVALGNILGTVLGGQLADRLPDRQRTYGICMALSAVIALALFGWRPGVMETLALGFLYVFANAAARPSLMAALANVPDEVRGTVIGLNVTAASVGWMTSSAVGGWLIAASGFDGFGPLAAAMALSGTALAFLRRG